MNKISLLVSILCICQFAFFAQESSSYQKPPKEILDLVDYERAPSVFMDSKKNMLVFGYRDTYKTLEDLGQEEMRLGGLRINPTTNISTQLTYFTNLKVRAFDGKELIQVKNLPNQPRIAYLTWSPNEEQIAFTHTSPTGVELWVLNVKDASAKKISSRYLNANTGNPIAWFKDGKSLLVKYLPKKRIALIDRNKETPTGPTVSSSDGAKAQNRTYQDLIKNKTDEANFEALVASELVKVNVSGTETAWKESNLYVGMSFSADGTHVLLTTLQKPFSYLVPYQRFPMKQEVFSDAAVLVKLVNEIQLSEVLPKGFMAVRTGKRNMSWRDDEPASLYFVEALDEGNPEKEMAFRDELFSWNAPFTDPAVSLLRLKQRFSYVLWGNSTTAVAYDSWWNSRNTKTYVFNPSIKNQEGKVISDRNEQDAYSNPGEFAMVKNAFGKEVLFLNGVEAYLVGEGFTEKGQFPFIDKISLNSAKKQRIYQSTFTDKLENIIDFIDIKKGTVLVNIQSKTDYPNYYIRNLKSNKLQQITNFENPFKAISGVHKEVISYKRADGVELTATLYLPIGFDKSKKEKMPMIMWAYPREFKDKNSAGQNTTNPNEFIFPFYGSPIYWVTQGYVVLDDAAFPIIGEGEAEPNDTFIAQLVANAEAAINAVDAMGYIDRNRVAVGGHSYGAFMTANLLTHSKLFACGVARSGAYNRTLTPFGFQSEERSYWDVPEVYNTMSPFMTADKMDTPLLLIHGEADNNPGTFTLQSERYFNALKGMGKPTRLVVLPRESHGYAAKESILHVLWEQHQWFEKYLKKK
jgi:dipeptidyl aminopeptidase/acylaminoacyl peptidase